MSYVRTAKEAAEKGRRHAACALAREFRQPDQIRFLFNSLLAHIASPAALHSISRVKAVVLMDIFRFKNM
jgi:hypothetical protein